MPEGVPNRVDVHLTPVTVSGVDRISIRIHHLVGDGLQPVRAHERLEPPFVRVQSEALEVRANAVVAGEPYRRQQLGHDRLPEIPTGELSDRRDLEVEEVEEGKSAGSAAGPVHDAREDSVLGEHVAVPEVAVAEAAGQLSRLGREHVGQLPHLVCAARIAEPRNDLRVLLDVKAGAGAAVERVELDEEIDAVPLQRGRECR